ncbi:MAG: ABC transporter substrate-binding protein [Campylobacterota bacterium]|nr:ABC transporter substrate-binding protein [Campylobacterota bacterium]
MQIIITLIITVMLIILYLFISEKKELNNNIPKVAFISLSEVDNATFSGFKEQMEQLGWFNNKNIKYIKTKPAETIENLDNIVSSALKKDPDLIFVSSTPATQTVKKHLQSKNLKIPVLFCPVNDPVLANIIKNPNSPEGLITGIRPPRGDSKRFDWLLKISPHIKKVLIPYTPKDDSSLASRKEINNLFKTSKVEIIELPFENGKNVGVFLKELPMGIDAIFLPRDSKVESEVEKFVDYTLKHKIPLCVPSYQQVSKGALFAFGFIHTELGKTAANYADKILKGVSVYNLPVKMGYSHLILNKKTADIIGVKFDPFTISQAKSILE